MSIAVDTSAVVAVVLGESDAELYAAALDAHRGDAMMSAASLLETQIVVETKHGAAARSDLDLLLDDVGMEVAPFDVDQARVALQGWLRFGKGRHAAALNLGDCFAYALATTRGLPLLFKGEDFRQTDVRAAL